MILMETQKDICQQVPTSLMQFIENVPQGSIVDPFIFLIHINDISNHIGKENLVILQKTHPFFLPMSLNNEHLNFLEQETTMKSSLRCRQFSGSLNCAVEHCSTLRQAQGNCPFIFKNRTAWVNILITSSMTVQIFMYKKYQVLMQGLHQAVEDVIYY